MKLVLISLLALSTLAHADMNMKPGLWSMQVAYEKDGKKVNVSQQIADAMAKIPMEQRKLMQEKLGNMASDNGTQTCFTKEMMSPEKMLQQQSKKKCDVKFTSNTPSLVAGTFTCEDGTKGDMKWESAPEKMNGKVNMTSPKHGKTIVDLSGKFVSADCGKVKPPTAL